MITSIQLTAGDFALTWIFCYGFLEGISSSILQIILIKSNGCQCVVGMDPIGNMPGSSFSHTISTRNDLGEPLQFQRTVFEKRLFYGIYVQGLFGGQSNPQEELCQGVSCYVDWAQM